MIEKVTVALIGGGRTGTPLMKELIGYPYISMVGVADKNPNAASIRTAKQQGIFHTTEPMELVDNSADTDILIEVTGDVELKKKIKERLEKNNNCKTIIMHELIARLLMSICMGRKTLVPCLHPHNVGVGD